MNPSRSFRRGFVEGFTSPLTLLTGRSLRFRRAQIAPDVAAWREIGVLLNQAYREVGQEIGENTVKAHAKDTKRRAG